MNYHGITIDLNRDSRLSEQAMQLLQDYYLLTEERSPQEAFARAALAYSAGDMGLAQRVYDYASKGWFMYASPVLSNAPKWGEKPKALPISCFLTYVGDNLDELIGHNAEVAWLSVKGGGVGGHWSDVRCVSDKAPGPIPFLKVVDSQMTAYKQGKTRKGSYAAYLDVSHPDIVEFVNFKLPTGGDINRKCFNLFNAVNVTDEFMQAVVDGADWELKDPSNGQVRETTPARQLWQRILEARFRTGSPYINFIDTANKGLPQEQKDKGLKIHGSNLCNEIHLATSEERTAVCCLSSVNLEKFDEWKDTRMVRDLIRFLDNVLQVFIDNAPDDIAKARFSAQQERSLGLGAMGFHGYLQNKNVSFESVAAKLINRNMFKHMQDEAAKETQILAEERGSCPDAHDFIKIETDTGTLVLSKHKKVVAKRNNISITLLVNDLLEGDELVSLQSV